MPRFANHIEAPRLFWLGANFHRIAGKPVTFEGLSFWRKHCFLQCFAVCCILFFNCDFGTQCFGAETPAANVSLDPGGADTKNDDKPTQLSGNQGSSSDPSEKAMVLLKTRCVRCHNEEKKKGGLVLVSSETLAAGSDNGPVIVQEAAESSTLIQVLMPNADPHMPPKEQFEEDEINVLRNWISEGAKWNDEAFQGAILISDIDPTTFGDLPDSYQPVLALALSHDDKWLAVGGGSQIDIYECGETNHVISRRLEGHRDAVQSLAWSSDGKWLASGGFRSIRLWDTESFSEPLEITELVGRITALDFSADNALLCVADGIETQNGVIRIFGVGKSEPIRSWTAHDDTILALKVSPDGKTLASASVDRLVKLWEIQGFNEVAKLEGHNGHVIALGFKPDGSQLATGGSDLDVKIWDLESLSQVASITGHPAPVTDLVWTSDGKNILTACDDGKVRVCSESKKRPGKTVGTAQDVLYKFVISSDGNRRYGGCFDGSVYVWDTKGKLVEKLEILPNDNRQVAGVGEKLP